MAGDDEDEARSERPAAGVALGVVVRVTAAVSGALTGIVIARLLGPADSGSYAVMVATVVVLTVATTGGIDVGAARLVSQGRWDEGNAVKTTTLAGGILGSLGGFVGLGVYKVTSTDAFARLPLTAVCLTMAALPFALVWTFAAQLALANERYKASAALPILQTTVALLTVAPLAALWGLRGAAAGLLVGHLAAALAVMVARPTTTEGRDLGANYARLREAVGFGQAAFAANLLSLFILRADLFILTTHVPRRELGYYAVATATTSVISILPTALAAVVFPRIAALSTGRESPDANYFETKALRHAVLVSIAVSVAAVPALSLLISPVYGSSFERALTPSLLLVPGTAALGVAVTLYASLTGRGHPRYALLTALALAPVSVMIYLILIPRFGASGAALGSSFVYGLDAVCGAVVLRKVSGAPIMRRLVPTRSEFRDYLILLESAVRWVRAHTRAH